MFKNVRQHISYIQENQLEEVLQQTPEDIIRGLANIIEFACGIFEEMPEGQQSNDIAKLIEAAMVGLVAAMHDYKNSVNLLNEILLSTKGVHRCDVQSGVREGLLRYIHQRLSAAGAGVVATSSNPSGPIGFLG